jgi:hypothetical protein
MSLPDAKSVEHWYQVSGVDVSSPVHAGVVVTLGDSIVMCWRKRVVRADRAGGCERV